ncbi:hypothetical protein GIB67_010743 [Kingdonia uniflora]|uniref:Uncharacterized protein n=1 Tax=Kingdonia uniflora TaxID=39325 RepID=A0A7J7L8Q4_9MAGN|nr:hypothetical protein GIB67_010743 [Kingdonia uniflora]
MFLIFQNTPNRFLSTSNSARKEGRIRIMGERDDEEDSKHWYIGTYRFGENHSHLECCIILGRFMRFMKLEEEMGLVLRWIMWI